MLITSVKMLNNKELNNRLSNLLFPNLYSQVYHFTNDIKLIQDYLFPFMINENLLNDVFEGVSKEIIDEENLTTIICQHCLFLLIRRN